MKTKIEVGKKYKNRVGVVMTVVKEHPIESNYRERFWVVDETKNRYYYPEYTDGYAVNDFGGFGTYPNHRDLIEEVVVKQPITIKSKKNYLFFIRIHFDKKGRVDKIENKWDVKLPEWYGYDINEIEINNWISRKEPDLYMGKFLKSF